jgi:hypothetical protein
MRTYRCAVNFRQETRGLTLIQCKTVPVRDQRPEAAGNARRRRRVRRPLARCQRRRLSGPWLAAVLAAGLATGCAAGAASPRPAAAGGRPAPGPGIAVPAGSLVRVPRPDYSSPASVAAAFYVAWASTDAVHDQPGTYLALCAPLVTAALERQLAASQPAPAAWQAMHRARLVSLVRVQAVTHPDGAPAPTPSAVYLRVYATRVTTTWAGRQVASDGITVQLTRSGGRWLVSAVLFY